MKWESTRRPAGMLIQAYGFLDLAALCDLEEQVRWLEADQVVVLDLSEVLLDRQRDSSMIGLMLNLMKRISRRHGSVRFVLPAHLYRLLEITGVARVAPVYTDVETAFAAPLEARQQLPADPERGH